MNRQPPNPPDFTVTYDTEYGQYITPSRVVDFITSNPPLVATLDEPPVCGVSDRMERHIRLQFAAVVATVAAIVGAVVAILARAK